jgi:iron complex outermembrane receptor protein
MNMSPKMPGADPADLTSNAKIAFENGRVQMKRVLIKTTALVGVAAAALLPASRTHAQDVNAAAPIDQSKNDTIEEVVVTAQRREENLERVPIAVSAFSPTAIDQRVVQNSEELLEFVPNVFAISEGGQRSQTNYYFRGVGTPDGLQTFDSPVVTYLDDVPMGRITGSNLNFFDIERVEVLRGPQGTLFGENVTGGAVLYTSKKPTQDFGFTGQVEGGSRGHADVRGTLDVPITSDLLTSISGYGLRENGYLTDVYNGDHFNGEHDYGARASLRYMPTSGFEWNLSADYSRQDGTDSGALGHYGLASTVTAPNYNEPSGTFFGKYDLIDSILSNCETGASQNGLIWAQHGCSAAVSTFAGLTSNVRVDLDDHITVNFITGIRETRQDFSEDLLGNGPQTNAAFTAFILANDSRFDQYSQEVKFTGDAWNGRVKFVGGFFYFHEDDATKIDEFFDYAALGYKVPTDVLTDFLRNTTTSYAGYAQADTQITDELTLTTGYRYTIDSKSVDVNFFSHSFLYSNFNTSQIKGAPHFDADRGTPKVGLQYQFAPDIMFYASYTNGFKSGGWSGRATAADAFTDFRDEKVDSFEVGTRAELFDQRLRLNATLFRANYYGLQINTSYNLPNGTPVFVYGNAGNAYDQGLEVESEFVIASGLTANLNLGLQDSAYTALTPQAASANGYTVGEHLALTPPVTLSGGLSWKHDWSDIAGAVTVAGDFQYLPPFNPDVALTSRTTAPIFVLNSQIVYQPDGSDFQFAVECRNCLRQYYFPDAVNIGGGVVGTIPFWGARVKYQFTAPSAPAAAAAAAYAPPSVQTPMPASVARSYMVFFDFNKFDLTAQAIAIVDQAARNASPAKVTQLTVTGHTDTVGSDAYNLRLSRRRAESVAAELEKQGIPSSEIEIVAKGKRDLLVPTADGVREPQNRRVQIVYSGGATS